MQLLGSMALSNSNVIGLIVTTGLAAWTDWTSWRIPNRLLAGSAAAALMLALFSADGIGLKTALSGFAIGLLIFIPLYWVKGMAAGDLKLMAVIGLYTGPWMVVDIALFSCLVGGVWAIAAMAFNRQVGLLPWLALQWRRRSGLRIPSQNPLDAASGSPRQMIPCGVVIAIGTAVALL